MRVFIDTEFTDFVQPRLISIGLVAEDGQECYVELTDGWTRRDCSTFTRKVVVPLLQLGIYGKSTIDAARYVHAWLIATGPNLEIVSDSNYDLRFLDEMLRLIPDPLGNVRVAHVVALTPAQQLRSEDAFAAGLRRHNALDDARALRIGVLATGNREPRTGLF